MAHPKAHASRIYTNASPMGSALNVPMIPSALVSATNAQTIFVYVENHQDHVIQQLAMNAETALANAGGILSVRKHFKA